MLSSFLSKYSLTAEVVRIVKNIIWLSIDKVIRLGFGIILSIYLARYLGPEKFGSFNFVLAIIAIFAAPAGLGLKSILVRDIVREPDHVNVTLGSAAQLLFLSGILAYTTATACIILLRPDASTMLLLILIMGIGLIMKPSEICMYWFEAQILSKYVLWIQSIIFLFCAATQLVLIASNSDIVWIACALAAEASIVSILLLCLLDRRAIKLNKLRFSFARSKELLKESWPLMLAGLAVILYMKIDQIMIGQMTNDKELGLYSAAVRISEVWYFIPMFIVASIFPSMIKQKLRNHPNYMENIQLLFDILACLALLICIPIIIYADIIIVRLFGVDYAQAGIVLSIHSCASIFVFMGVASSQWLIAENLQILSLQRTLSGAVINIFANMLLIPNFGLIGAAFATLISYAFAAFFFDLLQKETRVIFFMKVKSLNILFAVYRIREKYFYTIKEIR